MQKRIEAIKSNEEVGVRYMQAWEEKVLGEQKAREEGLKEGVEKAHQDLVKKKLQKGQTIAQIADALEEDVEIIQKIIDDLES